MTIAESKKVLCVDDDSNLLEGIERLLSSRYDITTALGGREALARIEQDGPFAVVISDMRMPEMNGAALLAAVKQASPDSVRILLTGQSDLESAVEAINKGQIFRFLTKPCAPGTLSIAIDAALEQRRLIMAERVLLEQTLTGSIEALTDVLALVSPRAFGRATRVQKYVQFMFDLIPAQDRWALQVAALLSQVPCVTLPPETFDRFCSGAPLGSRERAMVDKLPEVADQLFRKIPRLEPVLSILRPASDPGTLARSKRALDLALQFDTLLESGVSSAVAFQKLARTGDHPADLIEAFEKGEARERAASSVARLPIREVRAGMTLVEDVCTREGVLVITAGNLVTPALLQRLLNFASGAGLKEPIGVAVRGRD